MHGDDEHSDGTKQSGGMGKRGVTRMSMGDHGDEHDEGHGDHEGNGGHDMGEMTPEQRRKMQEKHHQQTLWTVYTVLFLALWTLAAPFTFGYEQLGMIISDVVSGTLLLVFGILALNAFRPWALWGACFVGIWMQFAPLVFWASNPAAYLNNTVVGAFVIALTILIPGMPWMIMIMKKGPEIPPGWSYCPSSWPQRGIMILLGLAGWLVSRYLAAYQLGYIDRIWDPLFGDGSHQVLTSKMSQSWPISDAGLGAFSYTFEFLMGFMGSPARWRTMPWMVVFFGVLVVPLGLTHIILVISQPVVVGHWCFFCLIAALIMLPMIPLTLDEVIAMGQLVQTRVKEGQPFWRTFWFGETIDGGGPDERSPRLTGEPGEVVRASLWGMSVPWNLLAATLLGFWITAAPVLLGSSGAARNSTHVVGMLVITVTVIAWGEVARALRFLNLPLGLWLIASPWLLSGATTASMLHAVVAGVAVMALSWPRGVVRDEYGGWDRYIV